MSSLDDVLRLMAQPRALPTPTPAAPIAPVSASAPTSKGRQALLIVGVGAIVAAAIYAVRGTSSSTPAAAPLIIDTSGKEFPEQLEHYGGGASYVVAPRAPWQPWQPYQPHSCGCRH